MKYMWQFIVFKLLKKTPICWFLTAFLFQIGCGCLPKTSKEIDKARNRDNKNIRVIKIANQLNRYPKFKAFNEGLPKIQGKIQRLAGGKLLINPGNEPALIKVCEKFILRKYIPYLQVEQDFFKLIDQNETEALRKQGYKNKIARFTTKLTVIEDLLKVSDTRKLCEFIMNLRY